MNARTLRRSAASARRLIPASGDLTGFVDDAHVKPPDLLTENPHPRASAPLTFQPCVRHSGLRDLANHTLRHRNPALRHTP